MRLVWGKTRFFCFSGNRRYIVPSAYQHMANETPVASISLVISELDGCESSHFHGQAKNNILLVIASGNPTGDSLW